MNIEIIIRIHELISIQSTGIPGKLAEKLGLSERSVYNYLGYMKKNMNAPIKYNPQKQSYYYYEEVKFCFVGRWEWLSFILNIAKGYPETIDSVKIDERGDVLIKQINSTYHLAELENYLWYELNCKYRDSISNFPSWNQPVW